LSYYVITAKSRSYIFPYATGITEISTGELRSWRQARV
jgi:hypothetical protein